MTLLHRASRRCAVRLFMALGSREGARTRPASLCLHQLSTFASVLFNIHLLSDHVLNTRDAPGTGPALGCYGRWGTGMVDMVLPSGSCQQRVTLPMSLSCSPPPPPPSEGSIHPCVHGHSHCLAGYQISFSPGSRLDNKLRGDPTLTCCW